jgi:urease accessory protein
MRGLKTASKAQHSNDGHSLLRLMQLVSPTLPVGAYAYSHGLEQAVAANWVKDEPQVLGWISGLLEHNLAQLDIPVLMRLYRAWQARRTRDVERWNLVLLASRETAELRAEDLHMGAALKRVLEALDVREAGALEPNNGTCFATLFALAAVDWRIPLIDAANGYLWSWGENQVGAALKLLPLGQTAGQRILAAVADRIPDFVNKGLSLDEDAIGASTPGLAIASALHEVQYSRLFRS